MASTTTYRYTANPASIAITGMRGAEGVMTFSNTQNADDPLVRAVAQSFAKDGTTSGTITISVS